MEKLYSIYSTARRYSTRDDPFEHNPNCSGNCTKAMIDWYPAPFMRHDGPSHAPMFFLFFPASILPVFASINMAFTGPAAPMSGFATTRDSLASHPGITTDMREARTVHFRLVFCI